LVSARRSGRGGDLDCGGLLPRGAVLFLLMGDPPTMAKTIFKKIIDGEIPADILYQDEHCLAFRDVRPQAPQHVLIIPRKEIESLADAGDDDTELLGHLLQTVRRVAETLGVASTGYRVVINTRNHGGQTVPHLHLHLLAGRGLNWPPG